MPGIAQQVVVVIGSGGMGAAIARRQGSGAVLVLADIDEAQLSARAESLRGDGFTVVEAPVDVSSRESVAALARTAASLGPVTQLAHTAGLSPTMAPVAPILRVDLLGVALVLDEFATVIAPGGAGVVIASMGGTLTGAALSPELERALATTPTDDLLDLPALHPDTLTDPVAAYGLSKRANQIRVRAASSTWGRAGARINSLSPGVIATAMGRQELEGDSGDLMRGLVEASGTGRLGTVEDIAHAAAFLLDPRSSFITGTDLLVDGGAVAAVLNGTTGRGGA